MEKQNNTVEVISKRPWLIPVMFGLMCTFLVGAVGIIEIFDYVNANFGFSIGAEIVTIMIAIVIVATLLPAYKRQSVRVEMFVILMTIGCFLCFVDISKMCIAGSGMPTLTRIMIILVYLAEIVFGFGYWLYISHTLSTKRKVAAVLDIILFALGVIFALLAFVNFFYPLYFTVDPESGFPAASETYWIGDIYMTLIFIFAIVSLFISKQKLRNKIVVVVFLGIPVFALIAAWGEEGLSVAYPGMMIALVLVYSLLSYDNEKLLYSKSKELNLATSIQMDALPNKFPAFPDHKEFDIYALMHPAKEVGGDFYDFFLIDKDHLGIVIADVSDKGVPSALFMMQSKIILQNYAMMGLSPKEVLYKANKQLCASHQHRLFVTVWFATLDLKTGLLTAANGGHEYPIVKGAGANFEIYKDKHDLVVGFMDGVPYREYQIQLEKGSKVFVYTDGVPECVGNDGQYQLERALKALQRYEYETPEVICKSMLDELKVFMGTNDQFDDITMLCLEYKGCEEQ